MTQLDPMREEGGPDPGESGGTGAGAGLLGKSKARTTTVRGRLTPVAAVTINNGEACSAERIDRFGLAGCFVAGEGETLPLRREVPPGSPHGAERTSCRPHPPLRYDATVRN
jgi:hypothetical protein